MHDQQGNEDEDFEGEEFLPRVMSSSPYVPVVNMNRQNPVPARVSSAAPTNTAKVPPVPAKAPSSTVETAAATAVSAAKSPSSTVNAVAAGAAVDAANPSEKT